jgi:hypothetical protein
MAHKEWAPLESLPEVELFRSGTGGWELLRQHAIGAAWGREAALPHLDGRAQGAAGWSAAVIADLTR